jgi:DNA-binding transcriptional MerR regulator
VAEYRLDELARISGVSARNIRAYRERGLLDPPRRVGRSAYYDDYHLSQLKTINQLLRKGFNSAHIAEFFTSMRQGADLADILGIQRAVLGPRPEQPAERVRGKSLTVDIDPGCVEAQKLIEHGLAELVDGALVLVDPALNDVVARAADQLLYVRAVLDVSEAAQEAIDEVAVQVVSVLRDSFRSRFEPNRFPRPDEVAEWVRITQDYRELGRLIVAQRLDEALRRQMATVISEYNAEAISSRQWEQKDS